MLCEKKDQNRRSIKAGVKLLEKVLKLMQGDMVGRQRIVMIVVVEFAFWLEVALC